jgi:preprotein translocase subunit YajC
VKTFLTIFGIMALMTSSYAASSENSATPIIPMMIAVAAIAYFMLIRPQYKQQKTLSKLISNLKVADKIKLSSGIIGTIKNIDKQYLHLEIANEVIIMVDKSAVASMLPDNK